MTLEEAIEILGEFVVESEDEEDIKGNKAAKLGIEALRRIQEARTKYHSVWGDTLPGETKE